MSHTVCVPCLLKHHNACTASMIARASHRQRAIAGHSPSHRAASAHTISRCTVPLQPTGSQHSRCRRLLSTIMRLRHLQARAGASASHPRAATATALPLQPLHEGAATSSAECLSCHHQRHSRNASMLSTSDASTASMIARASHRQSAIAGHRPSPRAAPVHTVARCIVPLQPTTSQHSR